MHIHPESYTQASRQTSAVQLDKQIEKPLTLCRYLHTDTHVCECVNKISEQIKQYSICQSLLRMQLNHSNCRSAISIAKPKLCSFFNRKQSQYSWCNAFINLLCIPKSIPIRMEIYFKNSVEIRSNIYRLRWSIFYARNYFLFSILIENATNI